MAITSAQLVAGVKRRITIPANQTLLEDTDIMAFADNIIQSEIIPIMEGAQQDFFVRKVETPLVAGQTTYNIPYRSVARSIREIKIRNENNYYRNIPLISIENSYMYQQFYQNVGFHFEGDKIVMVPNVPSTLPVGQFLVIWYFLPPSQLVDVSEVGTVVSIAGDVVEVNLIPATMITGTLVDFVQSQSGSDIYSLDNAIVSVDTLTNEITFDVGAVPTQLTVGDFICLSGQSPVVCFVPNEAYPLIESLTAKRSLKAIGDYEGSSKLDEDISTERKNLMAIMEPRVIGEPTIIINPWSLTRCNKQFQRSWLYGQ